MYSYMPQKDFIRKDGSKIYDEFVDAWEYFNSYLDLYNTMSKYKNKTIGEIRDSKILNYYILFDKTGDEKYINKMIKWGHIFESESESDKSDDEFAHDSGSENEFDDYF